MKVSLSDGTEEMSSTSVPTAKTLEALAARAAAAEATFSEIGIEAGRDLAVKEYEPVASLLARARGLSRTSCSKSVVYYRFDSVLAPIDKDDTYRWTFLELDEVSRDKHVVELAVGAKCSVGSVRCVGFVGSCVETGNEMVGMQDQGFSSDCEIRDDVSLSSGQEHVSHLDRNRNSSIDQP